MNMRWIALVSLTVLIACTVDAAGDQAAIDAVIKEFNAAVAVNDFARVSAVFANDAGPAIQVLRDSLPKRLPWDERTALRITVDQVRFTGRGQAVAEATQSDTSPMLGHTRKWHCTFTMVKSSGSWKIASYSETSIVD
jgi:hypothetical protein